MASQIEKTIRSVVGKGLGMVASHNRRKLENETIQNPFLSGLHRPMTREETVTDLPVTGIIPAALTGRYLRNGPNPVKPPAHGSYHWFTGDAMVHGVRIEDGQALWYRNRWVRSTSVSKALSAPPVPGIRNPRADTANTNIIGHAGRIWAIVEAGGNPVELSDTLETVAHNPFDGTLTSAFTAHPVLDPATGELHAITYEASVHDKVWHVVVGADGRVKREVPIPVKDGPSIHGTAITANYILVLDLPVTFCMPSLIAGHRFPYRWNPKHSARIGLLPRREGGGETIWCDVEPCYVFHPGNAFETADGKVVVDMVVHETMFDDSYFGPDAKSTRLERWTIDPVSRHVDRKIIDDRGQEFPRYDERLSGQPYLYLYVTALPSSSGGDLSQVGTELLRHDLDAGTTTARDFGAGRHPGEFVFVPRAAQGGEDDGWLIGLVINAADETTDLMILNADDFLGTPQAVVHLAHRIPPGFHGNWIAD